MNQYRLLKKAECRITDPFWDRYIGLVKTAVIPYQWEILNDRIPDSEPSHAIRNFKIAAGLEEGHFYGEVFQDSDVAKWLEAVGNILMLSRDEELERQADAVIEIIRQAQEQDGYLDTYFTIEAPDQKWTNVLECHELYCAGHFIEAAVAYYRATGKAKIRDIAIRLADHICDVFGDGEGQLHGYPGHQEIEIALLRLSDLTGDDRYLEMAGYFLDTRGTNSFFEQEFERRGRICFWNKAEEAEPNRRYNQFSYRHYNQFHLPVREQKEAVGHAVRAVYMYTAMADLAGRTEDRELLAACDALWSDIVNKQMYLTGGIGATHSGEAFTGPYDLPNDTNYAETCASIGLIFFAGRMLKSKVDRTYGDVIDRALYNTVLGGMNYEGNRFFYVNPLEVVPENCASNPERNHVKPVRQNWFACACCPPNIARMIAGLWEYIYTAAENTVYVHMFIGSESEIKLDGGTLKIRQTTQYPWEGCINFQVQGRQDQGSAVLAIRIPEWSRQFELFIDNRSVDAAVRPDGYLYLEQDFSAGVEIRLVLDMKPRLVQAGREVHYTAGRAAIVRGPLIYCLEQADNGRYLNQLSLDADGPLGEIQTERWNGCIMIEAKGYRREYKNAPDMLYSSYDAKDRPVSVLAVPYFLWNNRGPGEMQVWVRVK